MLPCPADADGRHVTLTWAAARCTTARLPSSDDGSTRYGREHFVVHGQRAHRHFASSAPPATGEAVRAFRKEGRRHIAVASLFLAPGFLPDRAAELALEAGAVAVSEPLGAHPEIARTVLARYAVGAVELVPV